MSGSDALVIHIVLPRNRARYGRLRWRAQGLDCPVLARADGVTAARADNPGRSPVRPFGDTPLGGYAIAATETTPAGSPLGDFRDQSGRLVFGRQGVLKLDPVAGPALIAKRQGGRSGLWVHAGDLGPGGGLRPTHGCLRLFPADMMRLWAAVAAVGAGRLVIAVDRARPRRRIDPRNAGLPPVDPDSGDRFPPSPG